MRQESGSVRPPERRQSPLFTHPPLRPSAESLQGHCLPGASPLPASRPAVSPAEPEKPRAERPRKPVAPMSGPGDQGWGPRRTYRNSGTMEPSRQVKIRSSPGSCSRTQRSTEVGRGEAGSCSDVDLKYHRFIHEDHAFQLYILLYQKCHFRNEYTENSRHQKRLTLFFSGTH